ncbi:phosphodiester glycosidase family protein [Actinophytocola oryzae]|uniref:Sporulation related protein n=1 Tax=Actinophytocola oryzae TaxID=502181 RepID=A0A4R7VBC0_9PSEU|nr:phosphodiester glycosidase family protein [Actinophytocola oryzae]TDV46265.1 sporulation related protein [Actinophytocola oryzae]
MRTRKLGVLVGALALAAGLTTPAVADHGQGHGLPLGPRDLVETRTSQALQPGVTLTTIVRGEPDPADVWTVEVAVPGGSGSPDPDAPPTAISAREPADQLAASLEADGFQPRVEDVTTPRLADFAGGSLGFRVRTGAHPTKAAADAQLTQVRAAGFTASTVFTGWDGAPTDRGPWVVRVITIDPQRFRGSLVGDFGADIERRETTSALAAARGATAGVNAGFFVLDPAAGAPGDPAGVGVYNGRLLSEAVNGRPSFVFAANGRHAGVTRNTWTGTVSSGRHTLRLDGLNRVPGLIRNCGGTGDAPTNRPLHDTTCTDPDELIVFTADYGASTPAGPGAEAIVDGHGRVTQVRTPRGGPLPAGTRSIQATGARATDLATVAQPGRKLTITSHLTGLDADYVINGGPELVRDGRQHATPNRDGMVRPGDPSFYYGWAAKRNPRTIAGVDDRGRVLLVTVDGRATTSLGLSIAESAALAQALGMHEALNLDGGGSTTMVANNKLLNTPSDATGERPVGDALLVLPHPAH